MKNAKLEMKKGKMGNEAWCRIQTIFRKDLRNLQQVLLNELKESKGALLDGTLRGSSYEQQLELGLIMKKHAQQKIDKTLYINCRLF